MLCHHVYKHRRGYLTFLRFKINSLTLDSLYYLGVINSHLITFANENSILKSTKSKIAETADLEKNLRNFPDFREFGELSEEFLSQQCSRQNFEMFSSFIATYIFNKFCEQEICLYNSEEMREQQIKSYKSDHSNQSKGIFKILSVLITSSHFESL